MSRQSGRPRQESLTCYFNGNYSYVASINSLSPASNIDPATIKVSHESQAYLFGTMAGQAQRDAVQCFSAALKTAQEFIDQLELSLGSRAQNPHAPASRNAQHNFEAALNTFNILAYMWEDLVLWSNMCFPGPHQQAPHIEGVAHIQQVLLKNKPLIISTPEQKGANYPSINSDQDYSFHLQQHDASFGKEPMNPKCPIPVLDKTFGHTWNIDTQTDNLAKGLQGSILQAVTQLTTMYNQKVSRHYGVPGYISVYHVVEAQNMVRLIQDLFSLHLKTFDPHSNKQELKAEFDALYWKAIATHGGA